MVKVILDNGQFDILILAILLSPFITKLLVDITNAIIRRIRFYRFLIQQKRLSDEYDKLYKGKEKEVE